MFDIPWLVNPMTIPRTIRETIRYLLKRSWKVFLRKPMTLLCADKRYLKMAFPSGIAYVNGTWVQGATEKTTPLSRMRSLLILVPRNHMYKLARGRLCP